MTEQDTLAAQIAESIKNAIPEGGKAEVRINPTIASIPPHIAGNLLEFLRRVQCTGMESIAWVEAYQYVQSQHAQQPGVPFNGLPGHKA